MKLLRKFNPDSAPAMNNPGGPNNLRLLALFKDDTFTHYACFYDMWTSKIYVEFIRQKHSGKWDYQDFWQIHDDPEWVACINFLQEPGVEVLQMIESKFEKGMTSLQIHENMHKVPRSPYGVDEHGHQVITADTDINLQLSPSLWT